LKYFCTIVRPDGFFEGDSRAAVVTNDWAQSNLPATGTVPVVGFFHIRQERGYIMSIGKKTPQPKPETSPRCLRAQKKHPTRAWHV